MGCETKKMSTSSNVPVKITRLDEQLTDENMFRYKDPKSGQLRDIVVVDMRPKHELQPFYKRTGRGGKEGESRKGSWVPFDGIVITIAYGGLQLWFDKTRFVENLEHPDLIRYGTTDHMLAGKRLEELTKEIVPHRSTMSSITVNAWLNTPKALAHNERIREALDLGYLKRE